MLSFSVIGAGLACLIVVYAMRKRGRISRERSQRGDELEAEHRKPLFQAVRSVPKDEANRASEELRLLSLEREVIGGVIRQLYEAHAEGKITEEEREAIAESYKSRMRTLKDSITKDESVVALHQLEAMQEDLMKLFSNRFDELSTRIEELRSKVGFEPIKEVKMLPEKRVSRRTTTRPTKKETTKKKETSTPSRKTEAERRIEKIRSEVEKVLDRLGQMEIET